MFSKIMECLEQNISKQIACKNPSSPKGMNRTRNICIKMLNKYIKGKFDEISK